MNKTLLNNIKNAPPKKILQTLKKIQFIMQFFVLSRYSQSSDALAQFLTIIQAVKFYYKMAAFTHNQGLYIQYNQTNQVKEAQLSCKPLQRMNQFLEKIKKKPYKSYDNHPSETEKLSCGKKIQLITSVPVPNQLKRTKMSFQVTLGEILTLLRPLISIIAIRLFGQGDYKAYMISLGLDLSIMLFFQRNIKTTRAVQVKQMQDRRSEMIRRYLFRRPLFLLLKSMIVQPILKRIIKEDRTIYKIIISILEMQSSITLTL